MGKISLRLPECLRTIKEGGGGSGAYFRKSLRYFDDCQVAITRLAVLRDEIERRKVWFERFMSGDENADSPTYVTWFESKILDKRTNDVGEDLWQYLMKKYEETLTDRLNSACTFDHFSEQSKYPTSVRLAKAEISLYERLSKENSDAQIVGDVAAIVQLAKSIYGWIRQHPDIPLTDSTNSFHEAMTRFAERCANTYLAIQIGEELVGKLLKMPSIDALAGLELPSSSPAKEPQRRRKKTA